VGTVPWYPVELNLAARSTLDRLVRTGTPGLPQTWGEAYYRSLETLARRDAPY